MTDDSSNKKTSPDVLSGEEEVTLRRVAYGEIAGAYVARRRSHPSARPPPDRGWQGWTSSDRQGKGPSCGLATCPRHGPLQAAG